MLFRSVYTVAILDFVFDDDQHEKDKYRYNVKLADIETNKVFYDKLTFVYLEMPKFTKTIKQLETRFDKWLYIIRNLPKLDRIPDELRESIFERLFEVAEIAKFSPAEAESYEDSMKVFRDLNNSLDTAREEGMMSVLRNLAETMLKEGEPLEKIIKYTSLTPTQIEAIKNKIQ